MNRRNVRRRRGFTLIELMISMSIITILVPALFQLWRVVEGNQLLVHDRTMDARVARTVGDQLASDQAHLDLAAGDALLFTGPPPCERVAWRLEQDAVVRDAPAGCGGRTVLARQVATFERDGAVVELVFSHRRLQGGEARVPFVFGLVTGAGGGS